MPFKKLIKVFSPNAASIRESLLREWRAGPNSTAQQPVIVRDQVAPDGEQHVYVIWDDWGEMPLEERSEIIMQVLREATKAPSGQAANEVFRTTVAMGLTTEEAKRMGISYEE